MILNINTLLLKCDLERSNLQVVRNMEYKFKTKMEFLTIFC